MYDMNKRIHKILFTGFSVIAICTYLVSNKHFDFSREKKVDPIEIALQKNADTNEYEIKVNDEVPKDIVNMIIKHFDAMYNNDVESFRATLTPEDGADLNNEPNTMQVFEYYKNTAIYVKEIREHGESSKKTEMVQEEKINYILEIIVWNPIEQQDEVIYINASKGSGAWGISCYIPEDHLEYY